MPQTQFRGNQPWFRQKQRAKCPFETKALVSQNNPPSWIVPIPKIQHQFEPNFWKFLPNSVMNSSFSPPLLQKDPRLKQMDSKNPSDRMH